MAVSSEKEKQQTATKTRQKVELLTRACQNYEQLVANLQKTSLLETFDILYDMGKYQVVVDDQNTLDTAIKHNGKKLVVEFWLQQCEEEPINSVETETIVPVTDLLVLPELDRRSNVDELCGKSYGLPSKASRYSEKIRSFPGKYILSRKLGEGTLGAVYFAESKKGGTYAVKVIPKHGKHLPQEADVDYLKQLRHKRIVEYMYIIEPSGSNDVHVMMEFMHSGSLKEFIERNGPLDHELVKAYTTQILEGLDFLHSKNIIHQDLKPANLLLTNTHRERLVKIADFGSSRFASLKKRGGQQGRTPKYTDPGVSIGRDVAGRRSDIWSLGVIVIEMYTAVYPWSIEGEHPITVPRILDENEPRIQIPSEELDDDLVEMAKMMLLPVGSRPYASDLLRLPVLQEDGQDEDLEDYF